MLDIIPPQKLIPMDVFCGAEPIAIDVVYARPEHPENIFGIAAYDPKARMILHRDLARVVILAARLLQERHDWILILKDGLRPVEAQERLMNTDIVRKNPQWLKEPRLLSSPGLGAHPRGMAIDVSVEDVDMGTVFDAMVPESARGYKGFSPDILENRKKLESAFTDAGEQCGTPIYALPSEWWDFRIAADIVKRFEPILDADLPPALKVCTQATPDAKWEEQFADLAKSIVMSL